MPKNIEIKARISDTQHDDTERICKERNFKPQELIQVDFYFKTGFGVRKKLRLEENQTTKCSEYSMIDYTRSNIANPKGSQYQRTIIQPNELPGIFYADEIIKQVSKMRTVFIFEENTRVHLDSVARLKGRYMELEVMLNDQLKESEGQLIAEKLMTLFKINQEDLITGSYSDMV